MHGPTAKAFRLGAFTPPKTLATRSVLSDEYIGLRSFHDKEREASWSVIKKEFIPSVFAAREQSQRDRLEAWEDLKATSLPPAPLDAWIREVQADGAYLYNLLPQLEELMIWAASRRRKELTEIRDSFAKARSLLARSSNLIDRMNKLTADSHSRSLRAEIEQANAAGANSGRSDSGRSDSGRKFPVKTVLAGAAALIGAIYLGAM